MYNISQQRLDHTLYGVIIKRVLKTKKPSRRMALCCFGAGDEIRTHDPNLGKVMLYP